MPSHSAEALLDDLSWLLDARGSLKALDDVGGTVIRVSVGLDDDTVIVAKSGVTLGAPLTALACAVADARQEADVVFRRRAMLLVTPAGVVP